MNLRRNLLAPSFAIIVSACAARHPVVPATPQVFTDPAESDRTASPRIGGAELPREERRKQAGVPGCEQAGVPARERGEPPNDWFMRQRMSSGEPVPPRALSAALVEWQARRDAARAARALASSGGTATSVSTEGAAPASQTGPGGDAGTGSVEEVAASGVGEDAPGNWAFAGPNNIGGRITTLGVDPNDSNTLWVGSADGGVWKSADGGVNWTYKWIQPTALSIGALVVHPTDSNIVYVGTGEDNGAGYSYDGEGVYKTTDGGNTWTNVGLAEVKRIGKMAIDRQNPNRVFVAAGGDTFNLDANRGVYRTTDGGANWQKVLFIANDTGAIDIAVDPNNGNNVYAATWTRYSTNTNFIKGGTGSAIYKSIDGGTTWAQMTSGLPASSSSIGRIGIAIAKSSPNILYVWYSNYNSLDGSSSFMGIWKTNNGGSNWTRADTCSANTWKLLLNSYEYYFGQIRVDPGDAHIVYLLEVDWFRSTNSACSFQDLNTIHSDFHDQAFITSSNFHFGGDGGFYTTTNTGSSFTHASTLGISQFYDLGIDPNQPLKRFGGLQDNNVVKTADGGLNNWVAVIGGDGLEAEVDPFDSNRVYGESQYGNIYASTDGGNSFAFSVNGIGTERTNWKAPLTHDPNTSQRLYTGTIYVYRSVDGAQNWSIISPNLTNAAYSGFSDDAAPGPGLTKEKLADRLTHLASVVTNTTTAIGVSPVNTNILWVGTDDGNIWVTTNQGGSWTKVNIPGHSEWVTRVRPDPFDANSAFATLSGYRMGSKLAHIFRTTNLGATWTDITGGLPNVPLNCVVPDPQWKGRLFVCSDLGVYETDDWGATWSAMNGGLPIDVVMDINLIQGNRTLFAGTHGRSMWTFDLNQLPPPDRDGDGVINVDDCGPDDAGAFALAAEVSNLRIASDRMTLSWNSAAPGAGPGTVHDVLRGLLTQLPVGSGGGETCLASGLSGPTTTDASVPTVAQKGYWYLVRGRNSCGAGTYGTTSFGAPRTSSACP